jgi:tripartite-type tricarboxylate transporter receptor subunit TctC
MASGLLGGETGAAFFPLVGALPQAKAGKLRILALLAEKRSEVAPEVPTFREANIDGMDIDQWMALFAPAKTPQNIIRRIHQEVMSMIDLPAVRESNLRQGILPMTGTPEELAALLKKELARWQRVVAQAGIKPE